MLSADSNPREAFGAFGAKVVGDAILFAQLRGEVSQEAFIARTIELGAEQGLRFGPDEVQSALHRARRPWLEKDSTEVAPLEGWTPTQIDLRAESPRIDWCWLGDIRFTEPFFEQTVARALRDPARRLFRQRTSIAVLENQWDGHDDVPPCGFIFHVSRCGSTLVAQMLAASPRNHVISEAPPLDQLFSLLRSNPEITPALRVAWVRGMINALGRPHASSGRNYFIKFDSWHVLELPLIMQAFPEVPWIFLYRDPVEVMVSQQRQRGTHVVPGLIDPRRFDLGPAEVKAMSLDEYAARVLARIYTAATVHLPLGRWRLVNFSELPDAVWESLEDFWDVAWSPDDLARMKGASLQNAKAPAFQHVTDSAAKQRKASPVLRQLAARWLDAPYAKLEVLRRAQAGCPPAAASSRAESVSSSSRSQSFTTQSITR